MDANISSSVSLADISKVATKNYGYIKPEYLKPELSTKLYKPVYSYLERFYSIKLFEDACHEIGIPSAYLLDPDNWVSVRFGAKFAAKITEKTGDPEVYRKIGHAYFSPENLSSLELSLLRTLSPYLVLKTAEQFYRKRNVACEFKLEKKGLGTFIFNMSSKQPLYREMALNTLGILEAFQKLYSLDLFSVDLTTGTETNLHRFSLTMKFAALNFYLKRILKGGSLIGVGWALGYLLLHTEDFFGIKFLPYLTVLFYAAAFLFLKTRQNLNAFRNSNEEYYAQVKEKNQNLYEKSFLLERRYQEAALLKSLSAELVGCKNPTSVIEKCLNSIKDNFGYGKIAVFLISRERKCLYLAHHSGFNALGIKANNIEFKYPNPDSKDGFFASVLERGDSTLIHDIDTYKTILRPENKALLDALGVGSMVLSPIQSSDQKYGLFVVIRGANEAALDTADKFLVENIASQLSLYFESAQNFENEVRFKTIFQKYVPKTVLEQLDKSQDKGGALEPKRSEIVSIFMDLRGFTNACEGASPERAFLLVNLFSQFTTKILADYGAIIDNIIGDEVVAFFRIDQPGDRAALKNAIGAITQITNQYDLFQQKLSDHGFTSLRLGIGANFGEAILGSVGGQDKMNYTALGSTVNVASRLQSLTKKFQNESVSVLLSKSFLDRLNLNSRFEVKLQNEILRGTSESTHFAYFTKHDLNAVFMSFDEDKKDQVA